MRFGRVLTAAVCLLVACSLAAPIGSAVADAGDGIGSSEVGEIDATGVVQTNGTVDGNTTVQDANANEPVDSETIDELVETAMDEHDVAGATATVVEGDEIVHAEGYGYADYEADAMVDANETSFMVGSVSKLFVWTLVMQGVEDGTLDLDEPIGTYLEDYSFEGDDEVTLEHLGTHTPGYEDRLAGIFVDDPAAVDDWETNLERDMPALIREPGETVAYSNHGAALAGLVLQEVYDQSLESLVAERIYEPLSMENSTFEQPVPEDFEPVSKGHVPSGDGFETDDDALVGVPPAGSMSATAPDVANFAMATLAGGEFEDERILEAESVDAMFAERATNHPGVSGMGYGYMRMERGGEEIVWHTGGTEYFGTLFALFPERNVGLFVSFNSPGGGLAIVDVLDGFVEERFGDDDRDLEPDPATAERADRYEGEYRSTGIRTTYESVIGIADAWEVSVTDEGYLELSNPLSGEASRWVEVDDGIFEQDPDDDARMTTGTIAIEDGHLYMDAPAAPYERVAWYESAFAQLAMFVAGLAVLLSPLVVWPISAYRSRGWGRMREHLVRPRLAILACTVLLVAFLVGLVSNAAASPEQFAYGLSPWLRLAFALLVPFVLAALAAVALVGLEWRRVVAARDPDARTTNRYGLAYLTVLAVALAVFLWQVWYWNLLTATF